MDKELPRKAASSSIDVSFLQETPRSEHQEENFLTGIQTPQDINNKVEEWRKSSWRTTNGSEDAVARQSSNSHLLLSDRANKSPASPLHKIMASLTAKSLPHFIPTRDVEEPTKISSIVTNTNNKDTAMSINPADNLFPSTTRLQSYR